MWQLRIWECRAVTGKGSYTQHTILQGDGSGIGTERFQLAKRPPGTCRELTKPPRELPSLAEAALCVLSSTTNTYCHMENQQCPLQNWRMLMRWHRDGHVPSSGQGQIPKLCSRTAVVSASSSFTDREFWSCLGLLMAHPLVQSPTFKGSASSRTSLTAEPLVPLQPIASTFTPSCIMLLGEKNIWNILR